MTDKAEIPGINTTTSFDPLASKDHDLARQTFDEHWSRYTLDASKDAKIAAQAAEIERLRDQLTFIRDVLPERSEVETFDDSYGGTHVRLTMPSATYDHLMGDTP